MRPYKRQLNLRMTTGRTGVGFITGWTQPSVCFHDRGKERVVGSDFMEVLDICSGGGRGGERHDRMVLRGEGT